MIEVLTQSPEADREIAVRLARAKNIDLTEHSLSQVSKLARELIDRGFPVSDSFDAALSYKFHLNEAGTGSRCS